MQLLGQAIEAKAGQRAQRKGTSGRDLSKVRHDTDATSQKHKLCSNAFKRHTRPTPRSCFRPPHEDVKGLQ
jgi:hypothetical protein